MSTHILFLSPDEHGLRLAADLSATGVDVGVARGLPQAVALSRQYASGVLVLHADANSDNGRALMAALTMEPATAGLPLVVLSKPVDLELAVACLSTGVASLLPESAPASLVLEVAKECAGDHPGHSRARESIDPSGPSVLRRIARYAQRHRATFAVRIDGAPEGPAWVRWREGTFQDAGYGTHGGAAAVRELLATPAHTPWSYHLQEEELEIEEIDLDDSIELMIELDNAENSSPLIRAREFPDDAGLRVLLVDDDPALLDLFKRTFEGRGWVVSTAEDGERGYDVALASRPDLVVSDIMMPRTDGWGFLGRLRDDYRLRETPFVLLSCHEDYLNKLKALNAGADDYLEKGLRPSQVVDRLRLVMASRLALREKVKPGVAFSGVLARVGPAFLLKLLAERQVTGQLKVTSRFGPIVVSHERGVITRVRLSGTELEEHGSYALQTLLSLDDAPFLFTLEPPEHGHFDAPIDAILEPLHEQLNARHEQTDTELVASEKALICERPELRDLYLNTCHELARPVADKLVSGTAPLQLLASGEANPLLVESVVKDILRKGVAHFAHA